MSKEVMALVLRRLVQLESRPAAGYSGEMPKVIKSDEFADEARKIIFHWERVSGRYHLNLQKVCKALARLRPVAASQRHYRYARPTGETAALLADLSGSSTAGNVSDYWICRMIRLHNEIKPGPPLVINLENEWAFYEAYEQFIVQVSKHFPVVHYDIDMMENPEWALSSLQPEYLGFGYWDDGFITSYRKLYQFMALLLLANDEQRQHRVQKELYTNQLKKDFGFTIPEGADVNKLAKFIRERGNLPEGMENLADWIDWIHGNTGHEWLDLSMEAFSEMNGDFAEYDWSVENFQKLSERWARIKPLYERINTQTDWFLKCKGKVKKKRLALLLMVVADALIELAAVQPGYGRPLVEVLASPESEDDEDDEDDEGEGEMDDDKDLDQFFEAIDTELDEMEQLLRPGFRPDAAE